MVPRLFDNNVHHLCEGFGFNGIPPEQTLRFLAYPQWRNGAQSDLALLLCLSVEATPFTHAFSQACVNTNGGDLHQMGKEKARNSSVFLPK
jgi:hypothetical protein